MLRASDDATAYCWSAKHVSRASGYVPNRSVIAKAERISPFSSGISHFFCCSEDPYRARTSGGCEQACAKPTKSCTHVACVWSSTVNCLRGHMSPSPEYLRHDSILVSVSQVDQKPANREPYLEIRERNAVLRIMCLAKEKVPKPRLARLRFQFLHYRHNRFPSLCRVFGYLCMVKFG